MGLSRWGASDVSLTLDGADKLMRDAARLGVASQDLSKLTYRLGRPIADLARLLAPRQTGALAAGIRPVRSKKAIRVRVGSANRLQYAARRHWGDDGKSGPRFLSMAEEQLRASTLRGLAQGVEQLIRDHEWE